MEGSALLALSAYCKTGEERKKLRKELLSKGGTAKQKETSLENAQPIHRVYSGDWANGLAG